MKPRRWFWIRYALFIGALSAWAGPCGADSDARALRLDDAALREDVYAGDTVSIEAEVEADGAEGVPESWLCAEWTGGAGGGETIRPVPPLPPGGEARIIWRAALPWTESSRDSLLLYWIAAGSGDTLARAAAPVGPTVPGERFLVETGGGIARISLRGSLLLVEGGNGVEPWDLHEPVPMEHGVEDGREAAAGEGFYLCVRRDLVYRVNGEDGSRRRLSDPSFRAFRPAVAGETLLWARLCCGLPGEIVAADREGAPRFTARLRAPLAGGIACDGRTAAWIEEDPAGRTARIADLSSGSVRTALLPGAPLSDPGVSEGTGVCAARGDSGAALYLVDPEGDGARRIVPCPRFSAGPWCSGGWIAWAERNEEGESVFLRKKEGNRTLRIAHSAEGIEAAALSGSVFVRVDRGNPAVVRGIRVRWPGGRVPPRDAASLGFRFEGAWASAERVRIAWCFREDPGAGGYALFRARDGVAAGVESTEVAGGTLDGRGPYVLEDRSIPAPGEPEPVRYWLLMEREGMTEILGPLVVDLPERPAAVALLPDGPNPARESVRFVLTVPPGEGAGDLTIHVYDGRGRLVSRSAMARTGPGRIPVVWDGMDRRGRRASPGVYFIRVERKGCLLPARKVVLL